MRRVSYYGQLDGLDINIQCARKARYLVEPDLVLVKVLIQVNTYLKAWRKLPAFSEDEANKVVC
jgi:hypothetical protein